MCFQPLLADQIGNALSVVNGDSHGDGETNAENPDEAHSLDGTNDIAVA